MYIPGQKCFFALLIFFIRQVWSPAGWSPQHAKDSKVTSPIPRKTGNNAKRFENRGHLDAEQRGAAAHGTVSIACSSPLVARPLRTWPALNKRTFATKSSDFRVSFSKRFISDFDQRPDGQF